MERHLDRSSASNRPRGSHRKPKPPSAHPAPSIRLVTATGATVALVGGAIAVGTGAVPSPLTDAAVKVTGGTHLTAASARSSASPPPSGQALGYSVASGPGGHPASQYAGRHRKTGQPRKTAPKATASAPATAPMTTSPMTSSPAVKPTVSARPTSGPVSAPTASAAPTASPTSTASASGTLTPQATAEYQTPTGQNQLAWSEAILKALGDPLTSANIVSMGYWMQNEAGSPPSGIVGANNPINVSEPGYGGTQIQYEAPGYYLMSYPTVADGVAATAAYLNRPNYQGILNDLKKGAGLSDPSLGSEFQVYSGNGYSTVPDSWGSSQGTPLS
jgi:hypothetical protein